MNLHTVLNGHGLLSLKNDIKNTIKYTTCALCPSIVKKERKLSLFIHTQISNPK